MPGAAPRPSPLPPEEARRAVGEALDPMPSSAASLTRALAGLGLDSSHHALIPGAVADLPLPPEQHTRIRALARELARHGADTPSVTTGVAVLVRLGEQQDVPCLTTLGLYRELQRPAVAALDRLDRRAAAVVWLGHSHVARRLVPLMRALWADDEAAVRAALLGIPAGARIGNRAARRIAEAARLPLLLSGTGSGSEGTAELLNRAGWLLSRMAHTRDRPSEVLAYRDARGLYETVVDRAGELPPTARNAALLLNLAQHLDTGAARLLDWPPGRRSALLGSLERLLSGPGWAEPTGPAAEPAQRHRADWYRRELPRQLRRSGGRTGSQSASPGNADRLDVAVVGHAPEDGGRVETRILVNGRPMVPAIFDQGPAHAPEYLLDTGRLRACAGPREVMIAAAACAEPCCGALYVTIRRDAGTVVWDNWRLSYRDPQPTAPAYRFDAAEYDAEISRAEADESWSWPARTMARLITAGISEDPELLSRWNACRDWVSTGFRAPDTVDLTFTYGPGVASGQSGSSAPRLQFCWTIPDDGSPPEAQAAAALRRLREEDPTTYAAVRGGSREAAEALGFPWPPAGRG